MHPFQYLATLLSKKPEEEGRLLAALVNKMGDPSRKVTCPECLDVLMGRCAVRNPSCWPSTVPLPSSLSLALDTFMPTMQVASRAAWLLQRLLEEHPNMKMVVVREVGDDEATLSLQPSFPGISDTWPCTTTSTLTSAPARSVASSVQKANTRADRVLHQQHSTARGPCAGLLIYAVPARRPRGLTLAGECALCLPAPLPLLPRLMRVRHARFWPFQCVISDARAAPPPRGGRSRCRWSALCSALA